VRAKNTSLYYISMDTKITDEIVAGFRDKDSKKPHFRELYEKHDFLTAYSKHTDMRVEDNPTGAIGRVDEWETHGIMQWYFMMDMGMSHEHRFLDVGCGVGRAARIFAPYLDVGNYTGIDISPKALRYAMNLSESEGWIDRRPTFLINSDADLGQEFDFAWAHSVFTHLPDWQIEKMIHNLAKIVHRKFAFTYKFAEVPRRSGLKQFQFNVPFFESIARSAGFRLEDHPKRWPAGQRTIVLRK